MGRALLEGNQTVLLRKGGIKEPVFRPEARQFLLFPTKFHTDADLLQPAMAQRYRSLSDSFPEPKTQPEVVFEVAGEVTGCWTTMDPGVLPLTSGLHIWSDAFLEHRLKWRPKQPITILEVRARRIPGSRLAVPSDPDMFGCFSWVDLTSATQAADVSEWEPAIPDAEFVKRQVQLRQALAKLPDVEELLL